jgi:sigma-B regulation protein RsbU (phosphoserine phosphatase)
MLDARRWTLRYARAGHEPLLLFNPARTPSVQQLTCEGMTAGITSGTRFESLMTEGTLQLQADDLLLLFTDGITEVHNSQGELFGMARLQNLLRGSAGSSPREIIESILLALETFSGNPPDDDQTLVAARITG